MNTTLYPWGTHFPPGSQDGNYADKINYSKPSPNGQVGALTAPNTDGVSMAASVMHFRPNPFGLYDMGGNVSEWCVTSPAPAARTTEVQRGGAYNTLIGPQNLLSSNRVWVSRISRNGSDGFRVVVEPGTPVPDRPQSGPSPPQHSRFEQTEFPTPLPLAEVARRSVTNSLGMKFVPVPGTHTLFCIHETRNQDYAAYAAAVPGVDNMWRRTTPDGVPKGDHPVMSVNLLQAQAFCAWLSKKEGRAYRVPTDHEWSLAVGLEERRPLTFSNMGTEPLNATLFPWGTHFPPGAPDGNYVDKATAETHSARFANIKLSPTPDPFVQTAPVMSFKPNPFGLHDMGGNVGEWCEFPNGGRVQIYRGGTFAATSTRHDLLSSARRWASTDVHRSWLGFRVVLDTEASPAVVAAAAAAPGFEFPPPRTAKEVVKLSVTNSLGMKFLPVPITGGPTDKQQVLFSVWTTRVQDYRLFAGETKLGWQKSSLPQGPDHPAVNVSWDDANAFCSWLTVEERKAGKIRADQIYRLPSDHEWSCAAGIGELEKAAPFVLPKSKIAPNIYPWGTQTTLPANSGNYLSVESASLQTTLIRGAIPNYSDGHAATAPVGSYPPNHLGLYDMGGNVRQWCADWHVPKWRVLRGTWWADASLQAMQLSMRNGGSPSKGTEDTGFRVVLATDQPKSPLPLRTVPSPGEDDAAKRD